MTECREEKIEKFIELLKKYETPKDRFNPWQQSDKSDISSAPALRCDNLKKYLMERPNPKYILIGESPSIGSCVGGIVTFYDGLTVFIGCDQWIPVQSVSFVSWIERVEAKDSPRDLCLCFR